MSRKPENLVNNSSNIAARYRTNQPTRVPKAARQGSLLMKCKDHDYVYYRESWTDKSTGTFHQKGYYDETGKYYGADYIAFKKPDGSYEAHYQCNYCGAEMETNWKEGYYPTCKNCGAEMKKTPAFMDEIMEIELNNTYVAPPFVGKILVAVFILTLLVPVIMVIAMLIGMFSLQHSISEGKDWVPNGTGGYYYIGEEGEGSQGITEE